MKYNKDNPEKRTEPDANPPTNKYFRDPKNAEELLRKIKLQGPDPRDSRIESNHGQKGSFESLDLFHHKTSKK